LSGHPPSLTPAAAYGLLDGIFQQALFGHLTGRRSALDDLADQVRELMPHLVRHAAA
jgi:TetR/AcrR family transcriptional repressor of bet genes